MKRPLADYLKERMEQLEKVPGLKDYFLVVYRRILADESERPKERLDEDWREFYGEMCRRFEGFSFSDGDGLEYMIGCVGDKDRTDQLPRMISASQFKHK